MENITINQEEILAQSTPVMCENCGGMFFKQVAVFRKVSKLLIGAPTDQLLTIPVFRCDDCGVPYQNSIPNEDQLDKPNSKLLQ